MSSKLISFLAFLLTYAITRLGQAALHFKPTRDLPFWPGLAVEFVIWAVVFILILLGLSKLVARLRPTPGDDPA